MTTLTTDPRTLKAREIAATVDCWQPVALASGAAAFRIPSQSGQGFYTTSRDACSCQDFRTRMLPCKHIQGLELVLAEIGHN